MISHIVVYGNLLYIRFIVSSPCLFSICTPGTKGLLDIFYNYCSSSSNLKTVGSMRAKWPGHSSGLDRGVSVFLDASTVDAQEPPRASLLFNSSTKSAYYPLLETCTQGAWVYFSVQYKSSSYDIMG